MRHSTGNPLYSIPPHSVKPAREVVRHPAAAVAIGARRSAAVPISSPRSTLLACSIASAFRGAPALVDVRRPFYIAVADGAAPFRSTNVPSSSSTPVSVGVAPLIVSSVPESPDDVEHLVVVTSDRVPTVEASTFAARPGSLSL